MGHRNITFKKAILASSGLIPVEMVNRSVSNRLGNITSAFICLHTVKVLTQSQIVRTIATDAESHCAGWMVRKGRLMGGVKKRVGWGGSVRNSGRNKRGWEGQRREGGGEEV